MYLKYILFIFLNCLISVSDFAQNPPYQGTIFIEKDIINNKDCSAFKNIEYRGRGNKLVYDRRVNNWININAHLFDISWNDSLSTMAVVNPEFTQAQAEEHAMTYGFKTGQLPFCLRTDLKEIWIHEGNNDWGGGNKLMNIMRNHQVGWMHKTRIIIIFQAMQGITQKERILQNHFYCGWQ